MKKSAKVTLTSVAIVGLAACSRRADPCQPATFNEQVCREAVGRGGYFWNGAWYPMSYGRPYPYYYDSYRTYVGNGGRVDAQPGKVYGRTAAGAAGSTPSSPSVNRGGFGSTGGGESGGE
jgi:hypothetical protein